MAARNNAGGKAASTTEAGFKHVIIGSALYLRLGTVVKFPGDHPAALSFAAL